MKKKQKVLVLVIAFIMGISLSFFTRYAGAIGVLPPIIAFDPIPGQKYSTSLVFTNEEESSVHVSILLKDWTHDIKGVPQIFEPGTLKQSLAHQISLNPYEFNLQPGEKKRVQVEVEVPKGHEGARWAYLEIRAKPSKGIEMTKGVGEKQRKVIVYLATGIRIPVLQADPSSVKEGRVKDIKIVSPENSNTEKRHIEIRTIFQNTGDDFIKIAEHYVEIRDSNGDTIAKIKNAENPFILPNRERLLIANYDGDLVVGTFLVLSVVDFGGDYLAAGQRVFKMGED